MRLLPWWENRLNKKEHIWCPEADETFICPKGTERDMEFLRSLNIDVWDSFNWIVGVNGGNPFGMKGTTYQSRGGENGIS